MEEEEMFVKETEKVLSSKDVGNDLISLTRLQQKHKVSDVCQESEENGERNSGTVYQPRKKLL